jgi:ABC-type protease/lipase transport system fused ATPase/permease subunit
MCSDHGLIACPTTAPNDCRSSCPAAWFCILLIYDASARARAPVDLAIVQWKNVVAARRSYSRLTDTLTALDEPPPAVVLPQPEKSLKVERVTIAAPSTGSVILSDVGFELRAGQAVGIIGPSGGGKSTLARGLTGVWPLLRGDVRLDDADLSQWPPDELGRHIGYLPQDVSLLDATVSENICRLDPEADGKKILAAARAAGVHELIVRLPQGYETPLGANGLSLSAGQRQRIALARALYDDPFLVVLDEPNSNLDAEGEAALTAAVLAVRSRGGIVVVIAHRPSALAAVDMIGVIQNGKLAAFGSKEES